MTKKRRRKTGNAPFRIPLLAALFVLALGALIFGGTKLYGYVQERRAEEAEEARAREEERLRLEKEAREEQERAAYPLGYLELVASAADKYELPVHLVLSVIRTESSFRAEAVSGAGAIGLMQIMPETFSWLCEKRGETHETAELTDPAVNIDYGVYYLRLLLDYYDGSLDNALLAYNAGIGRVNGWLAEKELPRNGQLDEIPISETASYLTKVHHAMDEYIRIYKGDFVQ